MDTQRALQGHSRVTTKVLERYLSTWELEEHLGTHIMKHSGTWSLEALYLADSSSNLQNKTVSFIWSFLYLIILWSENSSYWVAGPLGHWVSVWWIGRSVSCWSFSLLSGDVIKRYVPEFLFCLQVRSSNVLIF